MAEVEVFGKKIDFGGKRLLLFGAIGIGLVVLLARRKPMEAETVPQEVTSAEPVSDPYASEFARITAEAGTQMATLEAMTRLEEKRIDAEYELAGMRLKAETGLEQQRIGADFSLRAGSQGTFNRQCIPWENWFALSKEEKDQFARQVRDGALLQTPTATGMCFTPTSRGLQGSEPITEQKSKRGLLGGRTTVSGPAGSFSPDTRTPEASLPGILREAAPFVSAATGIPPQMLPASQPRMRYTPPIRREV